MKKVLFGIMALSMAAFAKNPGTKNEASVPVRVIAEVIAATDGLVITDMTGNILTDGLLIDHETRVQGESHEKSVQFKVKKLNADGTTNNTLHTSGDATKKLTVSLDKTTTTLKHLKSNSTIQSTLALAGGNNYKVENAGSLPEHVGTITSNIEVGTTQEVGAYDNRANQDPMPVLKVVLDA